MSVRKRRTRPESESPAPLGEHHPEHACILVIEDDPAAVVEYVRALGHNGEFRVVHAQTGPSAIEHLSRFSGIECVICGAGSPGSAGFEMVRLSKVLRPRTPVLLIVPAGGSLGTSTGPAASRDDVLVRPFTNAELRARVSRIVKRGRKLRAAEARTVLAIGAHPDDVEIGVGGTLLRHAAAGNRVVHLVLTDGEAGGRRRTRVAEAVEAARRMGATLVRGRAPDAALQGNRRTVQVIDEVVDKYHPSVVYVHSGKDSHQDHRATYYATLSAVRDIPSVYCYQSPSTTVEFCPTRFVDIGEHLDAKVEIIELFRSQVKTRLYLNEDMIRATARYWGRYAAHRLVEPLEVVRQLAP
jgi:LmbE family N-acetylglucosaminyl deacetylase/CheY-like chemotaxis protein